jgi:transcriptional regulator with XRE-family HTH domain
VDGEHRRSRESRFRDPDLEAFGGRIKRLRHASGFTQEELAWRSGLHLTYVSQVECGERNVSYRTIIALAEGLGVRPAELMPPD